MLDGHSDGIRYKRRIEQELKDGESGNKDTAGPKSDAEPRARHRKGEFLAGMEAKHIQLPEP